MGRMVAVLVLATLVAVGAVSADDGGRPLAASGLVVQAPSDWSRVAAVDDHAMDPRTVLVVGSRGVVARASGCQVAAYRVPAAGAVVVVLGWRGAAADGIPRGRSELTAMRLRRPIFECWPGRGAVARIALKGRGYQVNVLAGDQATSETVADALAVARSLALDV